MALAGTGAACRMLYPRAMEAFRSVFFVAALAAGCGGRATSEGGGTGAAGATDLPSGSGAGIGTGAISGSLSGSSAGVVSGTGTPIGTTGTCNCGDGACYCPGWCPGVGYCPIGQTCQPLGNTASGCAVPTLLDAGSDGAALGTCDAGCRCFTTPETCPASCGTAVTDPNTFFCVAKEGSPCTSNAECDGLGPLVCAFPVADACAAMGSCRVQAGGSCLLEPACTCAGITDPSPECGLNNANGHYAHEPIAYQGPCLDAGPPIEASDVLEPPPPDAAGQDAVCPCGAPSCGPCFDEGGSIEQ